MYDLSDTIAAIATPIGESGIGIIRMSGKGALSVAGKIFSSKDGNTPSDFKTFTVHYGWIIADSLVIDEVLLTVMRAPKSYTKEDVVEINCHGGIVSLRRVLDLVLENGCRLADPGEFTKRAFLNGRIDLAQAEAVIDIIKAKSDSALEIGLRQLKGGLSKEINRVRNELLDILTGLEANIDFPEEEIGLVNLNDYLKRLSVLSEDIEYILDTSKIGRVFREGINVVICGKPNVGKSSLLNALLKQERSIVTPIAGTTRDTIEEVIDIKGIPVKIVDTAGIIEPRDLIERKAVQRSKKYINSADLVILLFDNNKRIDKQDQNFMRKLGKKKVIVVINKIDLKTRLEKSKIMKKFDHIVEISAKKMQNIGLFEEEIANLVYKGQIRSPEPVLVSNLRHIESIRKVQKVIAQAANSMDNNNLLPLAFVAQSIKDALGYLDEILGRKFSEDLLEKIFSEFCIGK